MEISISGSKESTSLGHLPNDLLFSLAIQLDLSDLLKFCSSSKKINDSICKKDNIWFYKLNKEFPDWRNLLKDEDIKDPISLFPIVNARSPKEIYITLYHWNIFKILKEKLKIKEDIYEIYKLPDLYLGYNQITEIPKEIGWLTNLQKLYLSNNQITEIPKEIEQLTKLQELYINYNKITEISKILKLTSLKQLSLNYNKITKIPKEIGQLTALQELYLSDNQITKIPKEMRQLTALQELDLTNNPIIEIIKN